MDINLGGGGGGVVGQWWRFVKQLWISRSALEGEAGMMEMAGPVGRHWVHQQLRYTASNAQNTSPPHTNTTLTPHATPPQLSFN